MLLNLGQHDGSNVKLYTGRVVPICVKMKGLKFGVGVMTISKKGSRKIVVGQEPYRWILTPSARGILTLTVQHDEVKGQLLRVDIESEINEFWVEFPNVESLNNKIVLPAEIALIIQEAIRQGWNPREKGVFLRFKLSDNKLLSLN